MSTDQQSTFAQRVARKCIHFNGLNSGLCRIGVWYEDVWQRPDPIGYTVDVYAQYPCFQHSRLETCDLQHFPTPDEVVDIVNERMEILRKFAEERQGGAQDGRARERPEGGLRAVGEGQCDGLAAPAPER